MKTYLSYGGGVNSTAMILLGIRDGWYQDCEAVFCHHGTDYPETYAYVAMFQWWLKANGHRPITILRPTVQGAATLYEWYYAQEFLPSVVNRSCTSKWKVRPLQKHMDKPCFELLGIDAGEARRARISSTKGIESRWPLIEAGMDREDCKRIIREYGLPVPPKSGCFICPFQRRDQWRRQRNEMPDLWCKSLSLEKRAVERIRRRLGVAQPTDYLSQYPMPLEGVVQENQGVLFDELEYPPCQCGL